MSFLDRYLSPPEVVENETGPWNIRLICNGLKCNHSSGKYVDYFEAEELQGVNAFRGRGGMTPLDVFERMMLKTPFTRGFIYKNWNIVMHESKGFIIKPRLNKENKDIEKYVDTADEERYRTNESLREIEMIEFLQYIDEPIND